MPEYTPQQFGTLLHEKIRDKNWTLEKVSQSSNISIAHLEHLIAGNFDALPPAPYVRGYLRKLGGLLDFDGEAWWQNLREETLVKTSGAADALPTNRFKEASTAHIWIGAIVIVIVIYVAVRFSAIFGTPTLIIDYPPRGITPSDTEKLIIRGTLSGGDKLLVNGEEVQVFEGGKWEKSIMLQDGLNTLEIEGYRFLGGLAKTTRQIFYTASATSTEQ
ncbi:MAG: helix-turn-helix domain-containing protein [Candidatus Liptonbacteria bacterium]|nr:helix-turn-helix domain-containing protein [Candidatus Liptonbacteria bacterium]